MSASLASVSSETHPPAAPAFAQALAFWLKFGFISCGGPAGQIAVMRQELVEHRRWISERRFLHALNCCMLLPGPEAQQLATYVGRLLHRTGGGIVAGVLFAACRIGSRALRNAALWFITAAVVGVILNLAIFVAHHVFRPTGIGGRFDWLSLLIGFAAVIALVRFKVGVIPVIGACVLAGLVTSFIA